MVRKTLGFVVLMLVAAGIVYSINPDFPVGVLYFPEDEQVNDIPTFIEAEILTGTLNEKYFEQAELDRFGLEVDLTQIDYHADLDLELLMVGCPNADCIPSIDAPRFVSSNVIWMYDQDIVIGVSFNGVTKAYSRSILDRHEIVNDTFGNIPVIVSYCPICNSAVAFVAPEINGEIATFGVSGRLYKSDLVMYDRVTYSFWSQIEGQAIIGPLASASPVIRRIPVDMALWASWKATHPDTLVLSRPTNAVAVGGHPPEQAEGEREKRQYDYSVDPYRWFRGNESDTYGLSVEDQRLSNKTVVMGIQTDLGSKAYEKEAVKELMIINDEIEGQPIVIFYDARADQVRAFQRPSDTPMQLIDNELSDGNSIWTLTGTPIDATDTALKSLDSMPVYWFAWVSFHPETELFQLDS